MTIGNAGGLDANPRGVAISLRGGPQDPLAAADQKPLKQSRDMPAVLQGPTRSSPSPRALTSTAAKPRAPTCTVCSPTSSPVVGETAATACERLWASPETIMTLVDLHLGRLDPRRTRLAAGAATLLSSHAGHADVEWFGTRAVGGGSPGAVLVVEMDAGSEVIVRVLARRV